LGRNIALLQAQQPAALGNGNTEFLDGLQLILESSWLCFGQILDLKVKICTGKESDASAVVKQKRRNCQVCAE